MYDNFVIEKSELFKKILNEWGYMKNDNIDIKGIIASQINECHPIILTEMIAHGYFDELTTEEVISLVSIFIDPIKKINSDVSTVPEGNDEVNDRYYDLYDHISGLMYHEKEIFGENISDWTISCDYINISYKWAQKDSVFNILKLLQDKQEYEGNFVRNMLKISNIIHDIEHICKISGKLYLLPVLENADSLIIRDIVSVNSLYL